MRRSTYRSRAPKKLSRSLAFAKLLETAVFTQLLTDRALARGLVLRPEEITPFTKEELWVRCDLRRSQFERTWDELLRAGMLTQTGYADENSDEPLARLYRVDYSRRDEIFAYLAKHLD